MTDNIIDLTQKRKMKETQQAAVASYNFSQYIDDLILNGIGQGISPMMMAMILLNRTFAVSELEQDDLKAMSILEDQFAKNFQKWYTEDE